MSPISIVGNSITDVFKVDAAEANQHRGECRKEFVKTLKALLIFSIAIFLVLFFLSEPFFPDNFW